MKRSGKEGRWAELPPARTRFAAEAAFLILVAVGAALARLSPLSIIALMLVAWLLVALIERASSRDQARAPAGADETDVLPMPEADPAHVAVEELVEKPTRMGFRWLFWRHERAADEPLATPTAGLEERPSRGHVRRIDVEPPPPVIELETVVAEIVVEEIVVEEIPLPPGPAVTKRALDLTGLAEPETARAAAAPSAEVPLAEAPVETPVAEPPPVEPTPVEPSPVEPPPVETTPAEPPKFEPRVEVAPEPPPVERAPPRVPEPLRPPPGPPPPAREWNIWDLERRAREQAGDRLRDEEWAALFLHLRQFANADGVLPMQFDDLVRESFSELIQAA